MKHIVCYSGGHSSALVAIEVVRRFGKENVILLNHDIHPNVEHKDIKRFKAAVAEYLQLPVTYANMEGWDRKDQLDVVMDAKAFKVGNGTALCSNRMKTKPFYEYLRDHFPDGKGCVIYYGFDASETRRIQRRASFLAKDGYQTDFPLALWRKRTIKSTSEIGITPPMTYGVFNHANCIGCLKAGKQHWYVVFCTRPDIWGKAKLAEHEIDYTILRNESLAEVEPLFQAMRCAGVEPTEKIPAQTFWAKVRALNLDADEDDDQKPCECIV